MVVAALQPKRYDARLTQIPWTINQQERQSWFLTSQGDIRERGCGGCGATIFRAG
jgi:hypothetical protein